MTVATGEATLRARRPLASYLVPVFGALLIGLLFFWLAVNFVKSPSDFVTVMQLLRGTVFPVPLVASGGITTGAGLAAALAAGAAAAQLGTVFMRCPEAGTSAVVLDGATRGRPTALTRAFTGRWARGIRNRFLDEHTATAPAAYPEIHYATSPLRQAARESGDGEAVNLWAGQSYQLATDRPAAEVVQRLVNGCRVSLEAAAKRISPP